MLTQTELPEKLYFEKEKELPKVLGGLKIGTRELVVVTGASSGLGLNAAATLAKTGRYFVVMACRDVEKAKKGEFGFWESWKVRCKGRIGAYQLRQEWTGDYFLISDVVQTGHKMCHCMRR